MNKIYVVSFDQADHNKWIQRSSIVLAKNAKEACDQVYKDYTDRLNYYYDIGYSYNTARRHVKYPFHRKAEKLPITVDQTAGDNGLPERHEILLVFKNKILKDGKAMGVITDIYHATNITKQMKEQNFYLNGCFDRIKQKASKIKDDAGWEILAVTKLNK